MRRTRILPLAVLGFLAACAADSPARSAPVTPPPEPASAPALPFLFGERTPVEDGATLQAYDADARVLLWLLGREGSVGFVAAGGATVTGFAAAPNRAILFDELAAARPELVIARIGAGTRTRTVSASEPGIPAIALLEKIAKEAGATKGVRVGAGVALPEIAVFAKDVRADALVAAIAAATATKIALANGELVVSGLAGPPAASHIAGGAAAGVRGIESGEAVGATLLATVIDARHRQALLRAADGGLRVVLDGRAVALMVEEGRVTADGRELFVVPEPPRQEPPPPKVVSRARDTELNVAQGGKKSNEATFGATNAASDTTDDLVGEPGGSEGDVAKDWRKEREQAGPAAARSPAAGSAAWAVEPFREKAGWLGTHEAALAKRFRGASWGDAFALALERALRQRGRNAAAVPGKLSDAQVKKLVAEQKLRWIVAGDLKALGVKADKSASLAVVLNVRKQSGSKMVPVDARTIEVTKPIGAVAPTDEDLLALMHDAAEKAADAVVLTIPSDLLAGRN